MAYRKLLTQKTYDELDSLQKKCDDISDKIAKDKGTKFFFGTSIVIGGDKISRYKIEVLKNYKNNKVIDLYGKDYYEIDNALTSFVSGVSV